MNHTSVATIDLGTGTYSNTQIESYSDQDIVRLVPTNKNAFAVLIKRYEQALARYMRRLGMNNPEDIIDVLQQIFIKAYRNIQSFDVSLSFSTWIYRIAHNETMSFFRSSRIRPEGYMVDDPSSVLELIHDEGTDIAEEVNQSINAEEVHKALQVIDEKYRTILVLRYFEEKEYSEISDILRIPMGSVATLIHRAKKQLSKKLMHIRNTA